MSGRARMRRQLRAGDLGAIVDHHGRVYAREHGVDVGFEGFVAASVAKPAIRGFPREGEAIVIVERDGRHAGSIGLTDEGAGIAALRWVLLDPELRGKGLGRAMIGEMVARAREAGYERLQLDTFSELTEAARIYLAFGFELISEETGPRWGRERITYQHYELDLQRANAHAAREAAPSTA
jgi:GNAT superfamily N-acetyltransferase